MALIVTMDGTENPAYQDDAKIILEKNGARYDGREIEIKEIVHFIDYEKPILVEQFEDNAEFEEYIINFLNELNTKCADIQEGLEPFQDVIKIENKNLILNFSISKLPVSDRQKTEIETKTTKTTEALVPKNTITMNSIENAEDLTSGIISGIKLQEWLDFWYQEQEIKDQFDDELKIRYIF